MLFVFHWDICPRIDWRKCYNLQNLYEDTDHEFMMITDWLVSRFPPPPEILGSSTVDMEKAYNKKILGYWQGH